MYFKRIEMHGFKSFADPVCIEFHEGITCIVGPNGSGKSNISDAIRWVLGEQSPKLLRGGKMEEVIFAGTTDRKSRGMAEVTLVIDNSSGILPIEYNEVAIKRRMYRSGESEYLINNNQCRLKDIRELIMDTGIGVDGYSIIGQGKISDIVSLKPDNRREIFEEAAGVVMYKNRKTTAERKLESAKDNLDRVNDIINEIEERIGGLREESIKAKEFVELRERYKYLEINLTLNNIGNLDKSTEDLNTEILELKEKLEELENSRKESEDELDELMERSEKLDELSKEANDSLIKKVNDLNTISSQGKVNVERINSIDKDVDRLTDEISEINEKLSAENKKLEELAENEKELKLSKEKAESKLEEAIIELNSLNIKSKDCEGEIDSKKNRIIEINNENLKRKGEINTLNSYKESLNSRKNQIEFENSNGDKKSDEYKFQINEAESKLSENNETLRIYEIKEKEFNTNILDIDKKEQNVNKKIEDNNLKLNRSYARKNAIQEMENNYEGYNNAVKFSMKAGLDSIYGTVADIIKVPDGLELAIETALGGAMQNIVCKDDNTAKELINKLKNSGAGRATFLPLESVKGNRVSFNNDDGALGIAAELIDFDEKFIGVINYLLGRVIISKTMDDAVRLSKNMRNGARFVTLDGEVVNASGAITGGKYKNKSSNLIERKSEILKLEKTIKKLNALEETLKNEKSEIQERKEKILKEKEKINGAKQSILLENGNLKNQLDHIKALVKETGLAYDRYEKEIERIGNDLLDADQMIVKYQEEIKEAEEESEKLNQEVDSLIEGLESFEKEQEEKNEEIVSIRVEVNEFETKFLGLNELIERINDTIVDYEDDLNDDNEELEDILKEKELLCTGDDEAIEKQELLKLEKIELEKYIEEATKEKTSINKRYNEINEEQKNLINEKNEAQDKKYRAEIKLAKNETQLNNIKDRLWEDFEISFAEARDMKAENFPITAAGKELKEVKTRLKELGDVNVSSIEEYEKVSKRYEFLKEQRGDILSATEELKDIIQNMDKTIKKKFKENFDRVVINFEEIFKELFNGGYAELRLEDESNPLESGIEIVAQPPGKKLKNINLMSGGEKTMTAIALMFAVLKSKPTPFCILDEVEAALDDSNIERFSKYLKKFKEIQFTLVTHQRATMEHADVLYGVTMPEHGISKVLSLRMGDEFALD
ncbi:MAG TPA: chromosome segregation protein SMC [Anaerovoracaceae bacterium]|nr:chromosome segregation protein SMC [Anaerovoracaceae bacterium]